MAGTYVPILNLSAFSSSELSALLTAAKAEVLTRLTGRVQTGASTGQSFGMNMKTDAQLTQLINALTDALGLDAQETRVRPCFSKQGVGSDVAPSYPYGSTGVDS